MNICETCKWWKKYAGNIVGKCPWKRNATFPKAPCVMVGKYEKKEE